MSIPSEQPPETGRGEPDRHKARGTEAAGATDAPQDAPQAASAGRVPQSQRPGGKKRKVALYVAFVGAGYSGMQYNPGARTIEGELEAAMVRAGAISKDNAGDFTKVGWNRAARTDKGVSAAGNVVSLKMVIGFPDIVERINRELPPQARLDFCGAAIRVLGFTRVTSGFEARKHCDCRRYEYVLPAAAFDPAWPGGGAAGQPDQANAAQPSTAAAGQSNSAAAGQAGPTGTAGVENPSAAAAAKQPDLAAAAPPSTAAAGQSAPPTAAGRGDPTDGFAVQSSPAVAAAQLDGGSERLDGGPAAVCTGAAPAAAAVRQGDHIYPARNGGARGEARGASAADGVGAAATPQIGEGAGAAPGADAAGNVDSAERGGERGRMPAGAATVSDGGGAAAAPDQAGGGAGPRGGAAAGGEEEAQQGGRGAAVYQEGVAAYAETPQLAAAIATGVMGNGVQGGGVQAQAHDSGTPIANGGAGGGLSGSAAGEQAAGSRAMQNGGAAASQQQQQPQQAVEAGAGQGLAASSASSRPFTAEDEARLNGVLCAFEGTHAFHNFTLKVGPADPAVKRYILSFQCAGTMQLQGQTWVRLVVLGQSFMLHQIRKMVGAALAVMRGTAPPDAIPLALSPARQLSTPMAPELGLFLDEPIFEAYNDRWGSDREQTVRLSAFQAQTDAFKRDMIYPHIASHDAAHGTNALFVRNLTDACYKFSSWHKAALLPPAPPAALSQPAKAARGEKHNGKRKAGQHAAGKGAPSKKAAVVAPAAKQEATPAYLADAAEWSD